MNRVPSVSVIMNCFNGEKYLRQAIDSVLAQTFNDWEIVFWDNQSTDASAHIVKSYEDPRLRYFHAPKHTWLYEARNYAMAEARGEFLGLPGCGRLVAAAQTADAGAAVRRPGSRDRVLRFIG